MIAIFDYGAGNLRSVQNTLGALGWEYQLVRDAAGLAAARSAGSVCIRVRSGAFPSMRACRTWAGMSWWCAVNRNS